MLGDAREEAMLETARRARATGAMRKIIGILRSTPSARLRGRDSMPSVRIRAYTRHTDQDSPI